MFHDPSVAIQLFIANNIKVTNDDSDTFSIHGAYAYYIRIMHKQYMAALPTMGFNASSAAFVYLTEEQFAIHFKREMAYHFGLVSTNPDDDYERYYGATLTRDVVVPTPNPDGSYQGIAIKEN